MDSLFDSGLLLTAARTRPGRGALFAEDFDLTRHREVVPEREAGDPIYTAAELASACAEARAEAWAGGHAAGTTEANASIAAAAGSQLGAIATALRDASSAATETAENLAEDLAKLLLDSVATVFPALCAQHGEAEVCALIATILPALAQEPTVTVRVNPVHTPALMRELDRLDPDLVERIRLVPVEAIAEGDVRVSWQDGTATRDTAALWRQVRAVLEPAGLLSPDITPANTTPPDTSLPDTTLPDWAPPNQTLAPPITFAPNKVPITIKEIEHAG